MPNATATGTVSAVYAEIKAGDVLSPIEVARQFPGAKGNGSVDPASVVRWMHRGIVGADGARHRLESAKCGSRWLTSQAAVDRFIGRISAIPDDSPVLTPVGRDKAHAAADAELEAAGV